MPVKGADGVDTYDHRNYTAPIQAVIGMAGFSLDNFFPLFVNSNTIKSRGFLSQEAELRDLYQSEPERREIKDH
ncbi:hypothetical protein AKJ16_DCAP24799 [Drosera capensis]